MEWVMRWKQLLKSFWFEQCKTIKPKAMVLHHIKGTIKVMPSHA
jgi:hypothetical protein